MTQLPTKPAGFILALDPNKPDPTKEELDKNYQMMMDKYLEMITEGQDTFFNPLTNEEISREEYKRIHWKLKIMDIEARSIDKMQEQLRVLDENDLRSLVLHMAGKIDAISELLSKNCKDTIITSVDAYHGWKKNKFKEFITYEREDSDEEDADIQDKFVKDEETDAKDNDKQTQ